MQWENCDYFWDFAVTNKGIGGQQLESVTQLIPGDVLQLRSLGRNEPDDFSHVIFTVDDQKLMFAQNSPPNFVYYSDLVNIEARFFRPQYLENHIIPQEKKTPIGVFFCISSCSNRFRPRQSAQRKD